MFISKVYCNDTNLVCSDQVLKRSPKQNKEQASEADEYDEGDDCGRDTSLYGKWQTEPLQLPHAVNGIVPRVRFCL